MAKTRVLLILTLAVAAMLAVGCASVPRNDTGAHGVLQAPLADRTPLPISIPPTVAERSNYGFIWPIKEGKVSSFFGTRRRDYHEGIDIKTNRGSPVLAAKDGEVIYSSKKIHGYGNMIVIKHPDGMATVYAHNRKNLVKVGEHVTQGQVVGYVGATGKATGPHLHFELRRGELPQDPLLYLPQVRTPAVAHK